MLVRRVFHRFLLSPSNPVASFLISTSAFSLSPSLSCSYLSLGVPMPVQQRSRPSSVSSPSAPRRRCRPSSSWPSTWVPTWCPPSPCPTSKPRPTSCVVRLGPSLPFDIVHVMLYKFFGTLAWFYPDITSDSVFSRSRPPPPPSSPQACLFKLDQLQHLSQLCTHCCPTRCSRNLPYAPFSRWGLADPPDRPLTSTALLCFFLSPLPPAGTPPSTAL